MIKGKFIPIDGTFWLDDVKYKVVRDGGYGTCEGCAFDRSNIDKCCDTPLCSSVFRKDKTSVRFIKIGDRAKH